MEGLRAEAVAVVTWRGSDGRAISTVYPLAGGSKELWDALWELLCCLRESSKAHIEAVALVDTREKAAAKGLGWRCEIRKAATLELRAQERETLPMALPEPLDTWGEKDGELLDAAAYRRVRLTSAIRAACGMADGSAVASVVATGQAAIPEEWFLP